MRKYLSIVIYPNGHYALWIPSKIARWLFHKLYRLEITQASDKAGCFQTIIPPKEQP